jgi:hypothetical protein
MAQDNNVDMPADPPVLARQPRTHTSPTVINMLKNLSLASILQKNKKIEAENDARALKSLEHEQDPIAHPAPGSEAASLITIDAGNLARLKVSSFFSSFREWIYPSLANFLADEELKEKEEKLKRKTPSDDKQTPGESLTSKRRCMDGSLQVERVIGAFMPVEFANSLFDTELHVAVPLPFFLNKNLRILIDEASTLPTVKSNPLPGESKGIQILDIEKLSARFGKELSLTCSQWSEAALNMFRFQQARDKVGDAGEHATWFDNHFNFFNVHKDRDELYDAWKSVELELRKDHRSQNLAFNAVDHDAAFSRAESSHKLRLEFQAMFASSQAMKPPPTNSRGSGNYNKSFPHRPLRHSSQSFPSGSGRSTSSNSCCLICAEKGHTVFHHQDSSTQVKFLDGKSAWSKCTSQGLVTLDNRPLCISWNIRGDRGGPHILPCTHSKEERLHQCSFCGSKSHFALSWSCRSKPAST